MKFKSANKNNKPYYDITTINLVPRVVEGDRGAGTRENRGGRWAGSGRRRSGMRESCEGGRREKNERH